MVIRRNYPLLYNDDIQALIQTISDISLNIFDIAANIVLIVASLTLLQQTFESKIASDSDFQQQALVLQQSILDSNDRIETLLSQTTTLITTQNDKIETTNDIVMNQTAISSEILTNQQEILQAIKDLDFKEIVNKVLFESEYRTECPSAEGSDFLGDLCEMDPFGVGPLNCEGYEMFTLTCPTYRIRPIEEA